MKKQNAWSGKSWKYVPIGETMTELQSYLADHFLTGDSGNWENLHDPQSMNGMKAANERINKALADKERIMVFGDFDADGVTSTVILVDALRRLGGKVSYRIPERTSDSHGLKNHLIDEIAQAKVALIITVDCGINDHQSVAHAASLGIDVIITDHHQPKPEAVPQEAVAVLNPHCVECNYSEKNLSGAGVVFKLVQALATHHFSVQEAQGFCQKYLDVLALGMIADCMPLTGEVRTLIKMGLAQFSQTQWAGLIRLMEGLKIDPHNVTAETIGFYIAPVINAASRLGDVTRAVQLFLGDPAQHDNRVNYLMQLNQQRKDWSKQAGEEALQQFDHTKNYQLIITDDWPVGVLGLVGSRLVEMQNQPIIVMRREGAVYKASCRSPKWANIEKCLRAAPDLFDQMGGHPAAAGFSLPLANLEALRSHLDDYYKNIEVPAEEGHKVLILPASLLHLELSAYLKKFMPFGIGAPAPVWVLKAVGIKDVQWIGADKSHAKLHLESGVTALFFRAESYRQKLKTGTTLDLIVAISDQIWREEVQLQVRVVDVIEYP